MNTSDQHHQPDEAGSRQAVRGDGAAELEPVSPGQPAHLRRDAVEKSVPADPDPDDPASPQ